jgi:hypothetical protein
MRVVAGMRDGSATPLSVVSSSGWNSLGRRRGLTPTAGAGWSYRTQRTKAFALGTGPEHAAGRDIAGASHFLPAPERAASPLRYKAPSIPTGRIRSEGGIVFTVELSRGGKERRGKGEQATGREERIGPEITSIR